MLNKFTFIVLFFTIILLSCNKKKEYYYSTGEVSSIVELDKKGKNHGELKVKYKTGELKAIGLYIHGNKNGIFKTFYKNGKLKSIEVYKKGVQIDTTKYYDSIGKLTSLFYKKKEKLFFTQFNNENIFAHGQIKDSLLTGWWDYFYDSGKLKKKIEYLNLNNNNKQYINQIIFYSKKGKIVKDSSNYITIDFPDTIPVKKLIIGKLNLVPHLTKKNNFYKVYFKYYKKNDDYNEIKTDSMYGWFNKPVMLWMDFATIGNKKVKGYVLETQRIMTPNKRDSTMVDVNTLQHKIYFEKDIFALKEYPLDSIYEYKNR